MKKFVNFIWAGIIVGFTFGLYFSLTHVISNGYIQYKMMRLTASAFRDGLNEGIIFFCAALSLMFAACLLSGGKIKSTRKDIAGYTVLISIFFLTEKILKGYSGYTFTEFATIVTKRAYGVIIGKTPISIFQELAKKYFLALAIAGFVIVAGAIVYNLLLKLRLERTLDALELNSVKTVASFMLIITCILNIGVMIDGNFNNPAKPNVVWFLIDALRADHLGCYGYERETSPFIDSFAESSVLFKYALSQESYTQASVPSYFTSTYAFEHQVLYDYPSVDILGSRFVTIAELLRENNYKTAGFVFNPHLKSMFNFNQGFDLYDDDIEGLDCSLPIHQAYETAGRIFQKVDSFLKRNIKRPVFLYLHYQDVHSPYVPPPPYNEYFLPKGIEPAVDIIPRKKIKCKRENREIYVSQYDGEIRYTDSYIEKTFSMLEARGINRDNSIIIITADHGEEFFDSHPLDDGGVGHGRTLYAEQIRVPLIISLPDPAMKSKTVEEYVELNDIAPTILDFAGIDYGAYGQMCGISLIPLIKGEDSSARTVYSGGYYERIAAIERNYKYYTHDISIPKRAGRTKYERPPDGHVAVFKQELYNIREDYGETENLIDDDTGLAHEFKEKAGLFIKKFSSDKKSVSITPDYDTKMRLRALGYMD
ncbi:MAG: sulfatase [Candidatus Omnitrophica bacterium]|nr:sulfatase [Candidatus Omnitrophota bacterium]